jgi:membrane-associated protein
MLDALKALFDFILHIDHHLARIIADYGTWTYGILFAIIFVETGLVIMPFLPGDSLLFAAGAFAARSETGLNVHLLALLLWFAGVLGDSLNYAIGARVGPAVFSRPDSRLLRRAHLERAQSFFRYYGGRAIVLARFVPIVRTFVPFVAGVGRMSYPRFLAFNVFGGFIWIFAFTYLGFAFGNQPIVQKNFKLVILGIIALSILPIVIEFIRARRPSTSA